MAKIAVLGAGSWGTTFAKVLVDAGNNVTLWSRRAELTEEINLTHRNGDYMPGINLPVDLVASSDISEVLAGAEQVYIAVPSQSLRNNLEQWGNLIEPDAIVVSLMKGVEQGSGLRMSEVIREVLGFSEDQICVVSGPNLSLEIASEQPAACVAACTSGENASRVAAAATNSYFTTFTNKDVIGTEFGGILKNLIAVAIGIVNGVGYGQNTKASIMTRGLAEISRFAVEYGAKKKTMVGLAGLGDLIATSESPLSRNHKAGEMLGKGYSKREVLKRLSQTAEGLTSVAPILKLASAKGVSMPIVEQVHLVIEGKMSPKDIGPSLASGSDSPEAE
ncbi:MAG: NAD(P)-dependent glycerol-3-phosphate dehydrogenase [Micrococcales bacterium]|nr:NAD(P)-dependent glycerol-3-phosphate dehydrogenase [Micrococcales bacterium]NBR60461.1 NAD(P)-dependent glycerol-3-phosphate dehydrogenase [Actinomycetota bacterium]NBR54945.1 NAD(P)-dependent glycerol-3-phosphate dehydrogenase [Micrococcales bacterium]NBT46370.1 NAD(P)-dependent glycerol-3-phosphate dehydrogenase [Actinomycetota bacterium]NBY44116.1 NAD(P)-dependent glycerol-3-phosphate dehydrogenase [Micrococcales bacterium]